MIKWIQILALTWTVTAFAATPEHGDRNEAEYNNQFAVVLDGYDPVSYFAEGGGAPAKGNSEISYMYGMRIYHFASAQNLELFKSNPLKYEPSYGSWCAYGMSHDAKVTINPLHFTINGNRLHFFISRSAKRNFDAEVADHEDRADRNWLRFSGERPRL